VILFADTGGKFTARFIDTSGKFIAGVIDTGGKFTAGVLVSTTSTVLVVHLDLRISPQNFRKYSK
jgi:hypothetical protein